MKLTTLVGSVLGMWSGFAGTAGYANNMATLAIAPTTGAVTVVPRWTVGANLAGFTFLAQDLGLGDGGGQFYSIKGTTIPTGGDTAAFTRYAALTGVAANHADIGSKLTPNSYSALTSADPDLGFGAINMYMIHHRATGDYLTVLVPGTTVASTVTDLKPMSGPGGPATTGSGGYFGLTFAAANLGFGANRFYYFRSDAVTGTIFGALNPALAGGPVAEYTLGSGGHTALAYVAADLGFGANLMYFLRLDAETGYTILGTVNAGTGRAADVANLGSVYSTICHFPATTGFAVNLFYATGVVSPNGQSVSFAPIAERTIAAGSFTVQPSASSGLPLTLTLAFGSVGAASITGPTGGVFTVTPTSPGVITLQATQAGQVAPVAFGYNMLRQSFTATGATLLAFTSQPQPLSQIAIAGGAASFTAAAGGTSAVSYQWRKNGVVISGNASASTATLKLSNVQSVDAGNYDVVATNVAGSIVSNLAVLAVNAAPPAITNLPLTATGTVGEVFAFTVTASNQPASFIAAPLPEGLNVNTTTGVISGKPTVAGTTAVLLGATSSAGTGTATLTLTILAAVAPRVARAPLRQTVALGLGATFTITADGNPAPTLQWQRLPVNATVWANVIEGASYRGVTSAAFTVVSPTLAMSGDQFRVILTNSTGSAVGNPVSLTVVSVGGKRLHYPASLAIDAADNLYVSNAANHTIEKITPAGVVSTFAGSPGLAGSLAGTGAAARFSQPSGLAIDAAGNLYVADSGNGMIRRITPGGFVTTVAGSAVNRGNADGAGAGATFGLPIGIAVDLVGNIYVADAYNATLRKITTAGVVSTLAGAAEQTGEANGVGNAARFNYPNGVTVDVAGNVYVADRYNHTIRKITAAGVVSTLAGSPGVAGGNDGAGAEALFNQPCGLAIDTDGNLFVADTGNATIRLVAPGGAVITLAGTVATAGLGDGAGETAYFNQPRSIVVGSTSSLFVADIFVADTGNALIRRISPNNVVTTLALTAAPASTASELPADVVRYFWQPRMPNEP